MRKIYILGFSSILIIGALLRFTYLDWGKPFFFHPDENNITNAIMQLSFNQWNPHFFAYGGLPIYFTFLISSLITLGKNSFSSITYTLRFTSASLSLLLLPSLFYIGEKMYSKEIGIIAALFASVGIGFIQFAHFGTFEMWLTFFTLWFFYSCYSLWGKYSLKHVFFVAFLAGALISVKVSSIAFLPIPLVVLLLQKKRMNKKLFAILLYCLIIGSIYILTNPFLFLDTASFIGSLSYESAVAIGTFSVFYTQSFLHTTPIIFQMQHVLPFLLNPIIFIVFLFSFFFFLFSFFKQRKTADTLLLSFFLITFLSQAFLFVKWTRYMTPTLPFIYLFIGIAANKLGRKMQTIAIVILFLISLTLAIAFVHMAYLADSRIDASIFVKSHFPMQKATLEPYDLGILPFYSVFSQGTIVNIYNLETDPIMQRGLVSQLKQNAVFLSSSQRLMHARLINASDFSRGHALYENLLNGSLGYHITYQTPCDFLCKIIYLGNPINGSVEETASVFDHPFVTIFTKSNL